MRISVFILLALIAITTACEYEEPQVAYHISGVVTCSESGDSLNGIGVTLFGFGQNSRYLTADSGKFEFNFTEELTDYTAIITFKPLNSEEMPFGRDTLWFTIGAEDFEKSESDFWGEATKHIIFELDSLL